MMMMTFKDQFLLPYTCNIRVLFLNKVFLLSLKIFFYNNNNNYNSNNNNSNNYNNNNNNNNNGFIQHFLQKLYSYVKSLRVQVARDLTFSHCLRTKKCCENFADSRRREFRVNSLEI